MTRSILIAGFALSVVLGTQASDAGAQSQSCDQRQRVIGHLATKYKEAPVALGVTNSGGLVEVLSTGDGLTWTIIVSNPDGMTCLLATGEGWRAVPLDASKHDPQA